MTRFMRSKNFKKCENLENLIRLPYTAMGKAQEMMDRKGQDDLMSVMIEKLKKDPGFNELLKIKS